MARPLCSQKLYYLSGDSACREEAICAAAQEFLFFVRVTGFARGELSASLRA